MKDESYPTTEALVASLQETESAPGTSGSRLARLKRRGLCVVVWLRRHPGLIATFGFVSGVSSFLLVERHEGVARAMAVAMLAGWLLLVLERVLDRALERRFGFGLPPALVRYLTQFTHQESLFFALPFFFASTSWNSGQAVFTGALGLMALVAILDPVYFGRLATRRWLFLGYHTLTLFALLLVVFPLVLQVPALASYQLALALAVVLSFPTLTGAISVPRWWRGLLVLALLAALGAAGWLARLWVPPATLRLTQVAVTSVVDEAQRAPAASLRQIEAGQLLAEGLYAYTAIHAPLGLSEKVVHVWRHEGRVVDRIELEVNGGRAEGYRAWTRKRNFPDDPRGRWQVQVLAADDRMIGTLRFRVE
ncbi:MAG: DUF2914 domain-containing protein [Thauera sp.]|nr:DUF2914 domain-containing protein [Thauera sp.]